MNFFLWKLSKTSHRRECLMLFNFVLISSLSNVISELNFKHFQCLTATTCWLSLLETQIILTYCVWLHPWATSLHVPRANLQFQYCQIIWWNYPSYVMHKIESKPICTLPSFSSTWLESRTSTTVCIDNICKTHFFDHLQKFSNFITWNKR